MVRTEHTHTGRISMWWWSSQLYTYLCIYLPTYLPSYSCSLITRMPARTFRLISGESGLSEFINCFCHRRKNWSIVSVVTRAECIWTMATWQHGFSHNSSHFLPEIFRSMFPDSQIAADYALRPRKLSYVVSHGTGFYFANDWSKMFAKLMDILYYSMKRRWLAFANSWIYIFVTGRIFRVGSASDFTRVFFWDMPPLILSLGRSLILSKLMASIFLGCWCWVCVTFHHPPQKRLVCSQDGAIPM